MRIKPVLIIIFQSVVILLVLVYAYLQRAQALKSIDEAMYSQELAIKNEKLVMESIKRATEIQEENAAALGEAKRQLELCAGKKK